MENHIGLKDKNGVFIKQGDIIHISQEDKEYNGYEGYSYLGEIKKGWFQTSCRCEKCFGYAISGYSWSHCDGEVDEEVALLETYYLLENGNLDAEIVGSINKDKLEDLLVLWKEKSTEYVER